MKKFAWRQAIREASESNYPIYMHGSVVESGGRIISTGKNASEIKHPKMNEYSTHAECSAIKKAGTHAVGAKLYVVRLTAAGKLANSKPCVRCQVVIKAAGIKKVYYSISEGEWGTWIV